MALSQARFYVSLFNCSPVREHPEWLRFFGPIPGMPLYPSAVSPVSTCVKNWSGTSFANDQFLRPLAGTAFQARSSNPYHLKP